MTPMLFKSTVSEVLNKIQFTLTTEERKNRVALIGKSWDFYTGNYKPYITQYPGEDDIEYQRKDKPGVNYTKRIVDTYVRGVFGRPFYVTYDNSNHQQIWNDVVGASDVADNSNLFFKSVQRIAEISDTCVVMVRYDKDKKRTYLEEVRGEYCYFLPDPKDPKKIGTLIIDYFFDPGTYGQRALVRRIEIWDKTQFAVWHLSNFGQKSELIKSGKNPYGFIPAVRFQPESDDNSFYGLTNVDDVVNLVEVYNNLWTSLVRIGIHQSFSVLTITGDLDNKLTIAPTRMLQLPHGEIKSDAKYITPDPKIDGVQRMQAALRDEIVDSSSVPVDIIMGSKSKSAESGYALSIKHGPLNDLWDDRKSSYLPSLKKTAQMVVAVDEISNGGTVSDYSDIEVKVAFSVTRKELSPSEQTVEDAHLLEHNVITAVDIALRKYPNLTRAEAEELIKKNKEINDSLSSNGDIEIFTEEEIEAKNDEIDDAE